MHNVRLPDKYDWESENGIGFESFLVPSDTGGVAGQARVTTPTRRYRLIGLKSQSDLAELRRFWLARNANLHSFRFKDKYDFTTATDGISTPNYNDVNLGTQAANTRLIQLYKKYTYGSTTHSRPLKKIVEGTVRVGYNGSEITSGFSVNHSQGILCFTNYVGTSGPVTFGCEFDVPVKFTSECASYFPCSMEFYDYASTEISIIETSEVPIFNEGFLAGGSQYTALSGTTSYTMPAEQKDIFCHLIYPLSGNSTITLPAPSLPADNGPFVKWIFNYSAVYTLTINNDIGWTVGTIGPRCCQGLFCSSGFYMGGPQQ